MKYRLEDLIVVDLIGYTSLEGDADEEGTADEQDEYAMLRCFRRLSTGSSQSFAHRKGMQNSDGFPLNTARKRSQAPI